MHSGLQLYKQATDIYTKMFDDLLDGRVVREPSHCLM